MVIQISKQIFKSSQVAYHQLYAAWK